MIANCGALGLDFRTASLGEYLEALEAHNDAHSPGPQASPGGAERMRKALAANAD